MSAQLTYDDLLSACSDASGARHLTIHTDLEPAAGPGTPIAPPTYLDDKDRTTYSFAKRFLDDGEVADTVSLDAKGSHNNRVEAALVEALRSPYGDDDVLTLVPRMRVDYGERDFYDCELPHRMTDGHFRGASLPDGTPAVDAPALRDARNATAANLRPLLDLSPISLIMGLWDSTRGANQLRLTSVVTGETYGVLASGIREGFGRRGAGRMDPVGASIPLTKEQFESVKTTMDGVDKSELSKSVRDKKDGKASNLGLGAIAPSLSGMGLISCVSISRDTVVSFGLLRQMRFGFSTREGDAAARALLAALAINLIARASRETLYRANCEVVEAAAPVTTLLLPHGRKTQLEPITVEDADALLHDAIDAAAAHGIVWDGACFEVIGNPKIGGVAAEDSDA